MTDEKIKSGRFWAVVVILGALIALTVGGISYYILHQQVEGRYQRTFEYVKAQSMTYDSFNDASTTKSLMRSIESASQIARVINAEDAEVGPEQLARYAGDMRLTGIVLLAPDGSLATEYSSDGVGYEQLKSVLTDAPSLQVAQAPAKRYTARVPLDDGSYADVACAARLDAPGIVASVYRTKPAYAGRYTLTLQSLMRGYEASDYGRIVIETNSQVVGSNFAEADDQGQIKLPDEDAEVIQSIKDSGAAGELKLVRSPSGLYYASYSKARDFYIYTYARAGSVYHRIGLNVAAAAGIYAIVVIAFVLNRRGAERKYLNRLLDQEHRYSVQLEESARAAQSANSAKTEFLQRMSHDIRTPINGIRGMVEVGNAYAGDLAKQTECREKIWSASGLLLDLVNEVLDMSKLESGEIILDIRPVDLVALTQGICEMLERQASDLGVEIAFVNGGDAGSPVEHPWVMASDLHVKRLLTNIASNAVKYNRPGGHVRLELAETSFADGKATYRIVIADDGIGMSESFQRRIYEPFAREGQELEHKPSGTGLGTAIARQLVELMGGTIEFTSRLGEGTTFTIELGFVVAADRAEAEEEADEPAEDQLKGLQVLLVEDNELNSEIAEFVLGRAGAEVEHVDCGEEAVEAFEKSEPGTYDVVLMDIMMPGIDGYEATRRIRSMARPDAQTTPIVAMSANAFADDRQRSREAGMNEHLAKPLDAKELVRALSRIARH